MALAEITLGAWARRLAASVNISNARILLDRMRARDASVQR
jgi:hypothetical protein